MTTATADLDSAWTGAWEGVNRLWLDPSEPAHESVTRATVVSGAGEHFLVLRYTWEFDGTAHDGVMLVNRAAAATAPAIAWSDSFHMSRAMMVLTAVPGPATAIQAVGSYAAPPGPDWGWRILLEKTDSGMLRIAMFNITPDGEEFPAVEAVYHSTHRPAGGVAS
jgi:hypothetical protein